jgi:hypothetical protein
MKPISIMLLSKLPQLTKFTNKLSTRLLRAIIGSMTLQKKQVRKQWGITNFPSYPMHVLIWKLVRVLIRSSITKEIQSHLLPIASADQKSHSHHLYHQYNFMFSFHCIKKIASPLDKNNKIRSVHKIRKV